jgi:hypothetical protein
MFRIALPEYRSKQIPGERTGCHVLESEMAGAHSLKIELSSGFGDFLKSRMEMAA